MALRATTTIAICLTAGIAAGIALARPTDRGVPEPTPVAAAAGVTPDESNGEAPTNVAAITIEGFSFAVDGSASGGSTVSITNLDTASHTLTSSDGLFDSGRLGQSGEAVIVAPEAPGTYDFFCAIHPSMTASLVVGSEEVQSGAEPNEPASDGYVVGY